MNTSKELYSTLRNLRYYVSKIEELAKQQFEKDWEIFEKEGVNQSNGVLRMEHLGEIESNTKKIYTYCNIIEKHIQAAEKLDKFLKFEVEEENEESAVYLPF